MRIESQSGERNTCRYGWQVFSGIGEASWKLFKAIEIETMGTLGQYLYNSPIRREFSKIDKVLIEKMLVELLCKRFAFVCHDKLSQGTLTEQ